METSGITEEQAYEALQQLTNKEESEIQEPEPETPVEEPSTKEEVEPEVAEVEGTEEAVDDDVASLKSRLEEAEKEAEEAKSRFQISQQRHAANEKILRDRFLRKSTVLDKAKAILQTARSEDGVSEADVARIISEIDGTMNPASASYVQPTQPTAGVTEDHAIAFNNFMSETGISDDEATEFITWIAKEGGPTGIDLSNPVLFDGYVRLTYPQWKQTMQENDSKAKRSDAVEAVKAVQRTQKQAAKAASTATSSPKKQPGGPKEKLDSDKLTPEDISTLFRQSVERYR